MRITLNRLLIVILMAIIIISTFVASSMETTFAASKSLGQPKITKAAVHRNNNVKLQWSKSKNAVKYKVNRKKANGKYALVKTTKSRIYYSKNLAYGTKYTYKVKAVSGAGKITTSSSKMVTIGQKRVENTPDPDTPAIPDNPVAPEGPDSPSVPDEPNVSTCEKEDHNYQVIRTSPATCTTPAYKYFKCSRCEATKQETTSPQLKHNWVCKNTVVPTYTEDGFVRYGCSRCLEYKFEKIPKLEGPEEPEAPVTPSEPAQPDDPDKPERTVTVKVPIYETDTVYWIMYNGKIIFQNNR